MEINRKVSCSTDCEPFIMSFLDSKEKKNSASAAKRKHVNGPNYLTTN